MKERMKEIRNENRRKRERERERERESSELRILQHKD